VDRATPVDEAQDLLLEIGTEELPASFVRDALDAMPALARELLEGAEVPFDASGVTALGTPRRLALRVRGVARQTPERRERVEGPPDNVAFDAEGKPTKAAQGFARKVGVDVGALTREGGRAVAERHVKSRSVAEVLPEALATLVRRIPFRKSMRWGDGDMAFGRPIHWLVALHGEDVMNLEVAGIRAGRTTRGHRFLAPEPFDLAEPGAYVERLRQAHVLVDVNERRQRMEEALHRAAAELGGEVVPDDFLRDECASLVEEPFVVPGSFDEAFLALPEAVVVSVMRDHQRYFALRDPKTGRLMARYLNVANTAEQPDVIARGNDRVLRARLDDARFFVQEDQKRTLDQHAAALDRVVFQNRLGSVGDKARRLEKLQASLGESVSGYDAAQGAEAAQLCKADLVTHIVGEFPELQGDMGRFYALAEGRATAVADALRDHYLPRGAGDVVPEAPLGAVLAVADRVDSLVGFFGIGLSTTGSADPYGLRRAALGVVRIALEGPIDVHLADALRHAYDLYGSVDLVEQDELCATIEEFFRGRLRAHYRGRYPQDVIEACLGAWDGGSVRDFDARVVALSDFRQRPEFEALAVAFKRAFNIAKDAPEGDVDPSALVEAAERALAETFRACQPRIEDAVAQRDYGRALATTAAELYGPINAFFEEVFVMVDDTRTRENRLRLLGGIARTLMGIAHFDRLAQ
jgi:glycyl-tRNA synthetase beta chain